MQFNFARKLSSRPRAAPSGRHAAVKMRPILIIYFATLVQCYRSDVGKVRHSRTLIRHGRSRVHFARLHARSRDLIAQIEAERSSELGMFF